MKITIKDDELKNITGGALSWAAASIVGGVVVFLIGFVDGYLRPYKCR